MILRRVIEHVKAQNWTAIAIDFVIVIMGVFIGIQVANWNAARADRASERHYLAQLREDLKLIEAEVRDQIEFEQFQSRLAGDIADEMEKPGAEAEQKVRMGLAQLTVRRTLKAESPTFADLQSSGKLEIISDPALRAAIITCFFRTGRLEAALDKNNQFFVDQGFFTFVRDEGLRDYVWDDALMGASLPASLAFAGDASAASLARLESAGVAKHVLDTPDMREKVIAQLSWRAAGSSGNEKHATRILEAVQALETTLAAHMDGKAP